MFLCPARLDDEQAPAGLGIQFQTVTLAKALFYVAPDLLRR